jgi:hypothetical protein
MCSIFLFLAEVLPARFSPLPFIHYTALISRYYYFLVMEVELKSDKEC